MKGFDVLRVKSAVKSHNRFDLSRTHLTTMQFGEIVPLFVEETVPGDKFKVDSNFFSRLAPLVKPTYGKFSFKTVSAFVPYHMLANDAEAWLAGKTTWEGVTPHHRWFTPTSLITAFSANGWITGATATDTEFTYVNSSGSVTYRKFTKSGKYVNKVLNALGYSLPQGADMQSTSTWYTTVGQQHLSAYPLLAFFKLYNDYMSQSQRFNSSVLSNLLNAVKYNRSVSGSFNSATGELQAGAFATMFNNLFLNYENDYFTSAWQQPNNAINSIQDITNISVPSNSSFPEGSVQHNTADNFLMAPHNGTSTEIGQRALDFLKSFDDWVRRNNYSGSRAVQQIYSRFGIKTDDYRSHYANVLKTDVLPVSVGDVTATGPQYVSAGSPQNVALGDYSGKGIMNGGNSIDFSVSDYGILFILGYFTVAPMMAYGFDRRVLRNDPLDYYNPEFDGIGAEAISFGETFVNPAVDPTSDTSVDNSVFGFTERYNSYRYGRDVITGEFRSPASGDMACWHTGRDLTAIRAAGNMVAQSSSMNTLPQIDSEYNRIFSNTSGDVDHFYLTAQFKVDAIRPMLNLNQVVKLGEGDTSVPRNGNVIS